MLKINITPNYLIFEELTDEMHEKLIKDYNFEFTILKGKYHIADKPENLYKLLLKLSYDFDIEIV